MCGHKPLSQADRKTLSVTYLGFRTEGRRNVSGQNSHLKMDKSHLTDICYSPQNGEIGGAFLRKLKEFSENLTLVKFVNRTRRVKQQSKKVKTNLILKFKYTILIVYDRVLGVLISCRSGAFLPHGYFGS